MSLASGLELRVSGAPDVRLLLLNRPENVALVRQALSGLAGTVGIDEALLADMKTAVSEACNNVVLHAYPEGRGPLAVYMCPERTEVSVIVKDRGDGIQPKAPEADAMHGVGLSLIQALTERVEFVGGADEGTEVRMSFRPDSELDTTGLEQPCDPDPGGLPAGETIVSACEPLVGPVLGSVIAVIAARSGFSVERLSEAQIVTDAIAAHARGAFAGRHVHPGISAGARRIEVHLGPLVSGGADSLVESSGVGGLKPVLQQLTDEIGIESRNGSEELRLAIVDAR